MRCRIALRALLLLGCSSSSTSPEAYLVEVGVTDALPGVEVGAPDAATVPADANAEAGVDTDAGMDGGGVCSPGTLSLGGGACSAPWTCAPGWHRSPEGFGCEPAPAAPCREGEHTLEMGRCVAWATCPDGWRRGVSPEGAEMPELADVCSPPPPADCRSSALALPRESCLETWPCGDGEVQAPDGPGCVAIEVCPPGLRRWSGVCVDPTRRPCDGRAAPPGALHVDAAAVAAGADGSPERPFPTIGAALAVERTPHVIAVAPGEYPEPQILPGVVEIHGACTGGVRLGPVLAAPESRVLLADVSLDGYGAEATLELNGAEATLTRVHLSGGGTGVRHRAGQATFAEVAVGPTTAGCAEHLGGTAEWRDAILSGCGGAGLRVEAPAVVTARGLAVEQVAGHGIEVAGGGLDAESLRLSGIGGGDGLGVREGGRATVRDVIVESAGRTGVVATGAGSELTLERGRITGAESPPQARGWGVEVSAGAVARLTHVEIDSVFGAGMLATGEGTALEVRQTLVRGTTAGLDGTGGKGVAVQSQARASFAAVRLQDNREQGLYVSGGAEVDAQDLVVSGTRPLEDTRKFGWGVGVQTGARFTASDVSVEGAFHVGFRVAGVGTRAEVERLSVSQVEADPQNDAFVAGVAVLSGAAATLRGVSIAKTDGHGLEVADADTEVEAERLWVLRAGRRTAEGPADTVGLRVAGGARAILTEATVAGSGAVGGTVIEGASLLARGLRILAGGGAPGVASGWGLVVQSGSRAQIEDALITDAIGLGITVSGAGSALEGRGLRVGRVAPGTGVGVTGRGAEVGAGATLELTDAEIHEAHDLGVFSLGGTAVLERVWVHDIEPGIGPRPNGYGVLVQSGGQMTMTDLLVERATDIGIAIAGEGTRAAGEGTTVRATRPQGVGGEGGRGLAVADLAVGRFVRVEALDCHQAGISAHRARVELADVLIRGTRPAAGHAGDGLYAHGDAFVTLDGFRSEANARAGWVVSGSSAVLRRGVVTGNEIGGVRRLEARAELEDSVRIEGNGTDEIACELSCPEFAQEEALTEIPE